MTRPRIDAPCGRLEEFEPSELADTAWAFGELQHYDYELMAALMPYLKAHAEKFDASGMAKVRTHTRHCSTGTPCHGHRTRGTAYAACSTRVIFFAQD